MGVTFIVDVLYRESGMFLCVDSAGMYPGGVNIKQVNSSRVVALKYADVVSSQVCVCRVARMNTG